MVDFDSKVNNFCLPSTFASTFACRNFLDTIQLDASLKVREKIFFQVICLSTITGIVSKFCGIDNLQVFGRLLPKIRKNSSQKEPFGTPHSYWFYSVACAETFLGGSVFRKI